MYDFEDEDEENKVNQDPDNEVEEVKTTVKKKKKPAAKKEKKIESEDTLDMLKMALKGSGKIVDELSIARKKPPIEKKIPKNTKEEGEETKVEEQVE